MGEALSGRSPGYQRTYSRSPYTGKRLRPFIWRDFETEAPFSRVLAELRAYHAHRRGVAHNPEPPLPLLYSHLRPEHLSQVNSLLQTTFWRDIDVTEALRWPDYSVVVRRGALVVGCALMTPQGYITYVTVLPMWRHLGLSTVMLHQLVHAQPDRDITLHVSVSNEAIVLYNKLGFKPEEYILDFYKDYLPHDTHLSPHAFLLRLRRS